jgi:hypothetical protein
MTKRWINLQFECDSCHKLFFLKESESTWALAICPYCGEEAHYTEYFEEVN